MTAKLPTGEARHEFNPIHSESGCDECECGLVRAALVHQCAEQHAPGFEHGTPKQCAGCSDCTVNHICGLLPCAYSGVQVESAAAPEPQGEALASPSELVADKFYFPCYHSRLRFDCAGCLQGHAARMEKIACATPPATAEAEGDNSPTPSQFIVHFITKIEPYYKAKHGKYPPMESGIWELLAFVQNQLRAATLPAANYEAVAREAAQTIVIRASKDAGYADSTWLDDVFKINLTERITAALSARGAGDEWIDQAADEVSEAFDSTSNHAVQIAAIIRQYVAPPTNWADKAIELFKVLPPRGSQVMFTRSDIISALTAARDAEKGK